MDIVNKGTTKHTFLLTGVLRGTMEYLKQCCPRFSKESDLVSSIELHDTLEGGYLGQYFPRTGKIEINTEKCGSLEQVVSTILHEIGHCIAEDRYGRVVGYNPESRNGAYNREELLADVYSLSMIKKYLMDKGDFSEQIRSREYRIMLERNGWRRTRKDGTGSRHNCYNRSRYRSGPTTTTGTYSWYTNAYTYSGVYHTANSTVSSFITVYTNT